MSKGLTIIDKDYTQWVENLSVRYRQSQIKAAVRVNRELMSQRHCLTDCSTVVRLYNCQEAAIGWKTGKQFLAIGVKIRTL